MSYHLSINYLQVMMLTELINQQKIHYYLICNVIICEHLFQGRGGRDKSCNNSRGCDKENREDVQGCISLHLT